MPSRRAASARFHCTRFKTSRRTSHCASRAAWRARRFSTAQFSGAAVPLFPPVGIRGPSADVSRPSAAWPGAAAKAQGYRFLGYRLSPDDRPTFLYAAGEINVEDLPEAVAGKEPSLRRRITLTAEKPVADLYHRAAVGSKIEAVEGGWYRVDGFWKIKVGDGAKVRQSGGKAELLVPVRFDGGKAQLVQEYVW